MIFTILEKYVYSKKCLKKQPQAPTPPSGKVEDIFVPKKSPGYGCYREPTCTHSKQGLWLGPHYGNQLTNKKYSVAKA